MLGVRHSEILVLLSTVHSIVLRHLKCTRLYLRKNLRCSVVLFVINQLEGNQRLQKYKPLYRVVLYHTVVCIEVWGNPSRFNMALKIVIQHVIHGNTYGF